MTVDCHCFPSSGSLASTTVMKTKVDLIVIIFIIFIIPIILMILMIMPIIIKILRTIQTTMFIVKIMIAVNILYKCYAQLLLSQKEHV